MCFPSPSGGGVNTPVSPTLTQPPMPPWMLMQRQGMGGGEGGAGADMGGGAGASGGRDGGGGPDIGGLL